MLLRGESIEAEVAPELGMFITSLLDAEGRELLWQRPGFSSPPRTREIGPPGEPSVEAMFGIWPGGWFEMSPHAGMPGELDGRQTMLHGEAGRLPWEVLDASPTHVEAQVDAVHEPLRLWRRIEARCAELALHSRIENRGEAPVEVCHGEHPAFARADYAGARIELQARRATVLPLAEPEAASALPGEFEWPHAPALGGGTVDLSLVPETAGAHDHVTIEIADPRMRIGTPAAARSRSTPATIGTPSSGATTSPRAPPSPATSSPSSRGATPGSRSPKPPAPPTGCPPARPSPTNPRSPPAEAVAVTLPRAPRVDGPKTQAWLEFSAHQRGGGALGAEGGVDQGLLALVEGRVEEGAEVVGAAVEDASRVGESRKPSTPWWRPVPLWPTPPKPSEGRAPCSAQALTQAPPEEVRARTSSPAASSAVKT